jgi:hypothetical protein
MQAGQLLNVVFGADAPRLTRTIEQELRNEELAKKGELKRPNRAPHELTPPEQVSLHHLELAFFRHSYVLEELDGPAVRALGVRSWKPSNLLEGQS